MPINAESSARISEFLRALAPHGIVPRHVTRSEYRVNDLRVSIRTTTKPGPVFWYDVSASVIGQVDYFLYQTDSKYHFALLPSSFLRERYDRLRDSNRPNAKQFYIDWDRKCLVSNPGFSESIEKWCCSSSPSGPSGNWKKLLGGASS